MKTLIIALGIMLTGCASQAEIETLSRYSQSVVEAQTRIVEQPTLTVKCGEEADACKGLDLTFIHPSDRHRMVVPKVNGTNDVIIRTAPSVVKGVTWLGGAFAATRIMDDVMSSAGGNNLTTHNTTAVNGDGNNTTATTSVERNTSGDTATWWNYPRESTYGYG